MLSVGRDLHSGRLAGSCAGDESANLGRRDCRPSAIRGAKAGAGLRTRVMMTAGDDNHREMSSGTGGAIIVRSRSPVDDPVTKWTPPDGVGMCTARRPPDQ